MDDRIQKLKETNVACVGCLRVFGANSGSVGKSCGNGNHKNCPMKCATDDCENDVLICKAHEQSNEQTHRCYRGALAWMEQATGRHQNNQMRGQGRSETSMIIVSKENEFCYTRWSLNILSQ